MNLPVEVVEATRAGRAVLFLGSGASREAALEAGGTYPDGAELARALGWKPPRVLPGTRPRPVQPSVSAAAAALSRPALAAALRAQVGVQQIAPTAAHTLSVRRFPLIFTTALDDLIERAATAEGVALTVTPWGQTLPEVEGHRLVRLRGDLETPVLSEADRAARAFPEDFKNQIRALIRKSVVFFVGYRPDEEEFEQLWEDLTVCYGAELPRCHLAVSSGTISDYQWQRWVWRGLLMFSADPIECLTELESRC